jgi:hypothetical protein
MSVVTIDRKGVFQKTAVGRAEIGQRRAGLAAVQRQLLIVIDGQKDVGTVAALFPRADVPEALAWLWEEGFIELAATAPVPDPDADAAFGAFRKAIETPLHVPVDTPADAQGADGPALAAARRFMADAARNNIGLLAERLIARIESAESLAGLAAVASQWHMALRDSKRGKPLADALLEEALGLLGAPAPLQLP